MGRGGLGSLSGKCSSNRNKALVGVRSLLDEEDDSIAMLVALAGIAGAELLDVKLRSDKGSIFPFYS